MTVWSRGPRAATVRSWRGCVGRTPSCGGRTRSSRRRRRFSPRRSSTADCGDRRLHRRSPAPLRGRADLRRAREQGITIAPSDYYAAKKRPPSRRSLSDAALAETIEATFWDRTRAVACTGPPDVAPAAAGWRHRRGRRPIAVHGGTADARARSAGRPPRPAVQDHRADPPQRARTGPGRPQLHRRRAEPALGGRPRPTCRPGRGWCSPRSSPTYSPDGSSGGAARPPCPPSSRSTPWRWPCGPVNRQVTPVEGGWPG